MSALDGNFVVKGKDCERLKDAFNAFLPKDFKCHIRYVHTPSKPSEPLFSPCPRMPPEKTRLASHFLTVSIPKTNDGTGSASESNMLVFAMEVLIYSSKGLVTMFVSKADSTGFLPLRRPSPIKSIATTFMWWLSTQQRQLTNSTGTKLVISLFARAQSQYLFPGSADHGKKHVLDDRQLIRWWARVLDPLFPSQDASSDESELDLQGYMTVPGYHGIETKSFFPSKPDSQEKSQHWTPGNPLTELAAARGLPETAPTRCILPRFPDDPKARFMQDLDDEVGLVEDAGSLALTSPSKQKSGRWKSINDLERFWEAMEFRQECSSGRVVGFLWLVVRPPPTESQTIQTSSSDYEREASPSKQQSQPTSDSQSSSTSQATLPCKSKPNSKSKPSSRKKLTGPIPTRLPKLKGSTSSTFSSSYTAPTSSPTSPSPDGPLLTREGYDSAMALLLNLDFASPDKAAHSTAKWVKEVSRMAGLRGEMWGLECVGTAEVETVAGAGVRVMNDLGGLVRRKRKADGDGDGEGVAGAVNDADVKQQQPSDGAADAGVNVLVGRKKAKT